MPKRTSLPSMLPPVAGVGGFGIDACQLGIAARFGQIGDKNAREEEKGHGAPDRPAMAWGAGHASEGVGEARRNGEDHQHLEEIGEGRGIFEWMSAVGVEKAAAIGSEHLDGFLRSDRTLRNGLRVVGFFCGGAAGIRFVYGLRFQESRLGVRMQILDDALGDEGKREDETEGKKNPEESASSVYPKIADGFRFATSDSANEGDGEGNADGGGGEVVIGEASHLREIAHRGFWRVHLPIGIGGEGNGGVPGEVGRRRLARCWGLKGSQCWMRSMR